MKLVSFLFFLVFGVVADLVFDMGVLFSLLLLIRLLPVTMPLICEACEVWSTSVN